MARERFRHHLGLSAANHVGLYSFFSSLVSSFVYWSVCLVSGEMAALHAMLMDVVGTASDSLQMEPQSILE